MKNQWLNDQFSEELHVMHPEDEAFEDAVKTAKARHPKYAREIDNIALGWRSARNE